MLSNTCKYAIRAVAYIALNENKNQNVGIKKISEDLDLPAPFLSKILQILSKNKILKSTKGPHGGFVLNKDADELNLLSIVEVIDGTDFFYNCIIGVKICKGSNQRRMLCPFHNNLNPLREQLLTQFKELTFGDFKSGITCLNDILNSQKIEGNL